MSSLHINLVPEKVGSSFPLSDKNANAHGAVKAFSFPVWLLSRLVPVYPKEKHSAHNKFEVAPVKGKEPGYPTHPGKEVSKHDKNFKCRNRHLFK